MHWEHGRKLATYKLMSFYLAEKVIADYQKPIVYHLLDAVS